MAYQYNIYCNTESAFVSTWTDTPPTACPNDAGHSVDTGLTYISAFARGDDNIMGEKTYSGVVYNTLSSFMYQGTDYHNNDAARPKYFKVTADTTGGGSYTIRLIDEDDNVLHTSSSQTNTSPQLYTIDFDDLTLPSSEKRIRLQVNTSLLATVTVRSATIYRVY